MTSIRRAIIHQAILCNIYEHVNERSDITKLCRISYLSDYVAKIVVEDLKFAVYI